MEWVVRKKESCQSMGGIYRAENLPCSQAPIVIANTEAFGSRCDARVTRGYGDAYALQAQLHEFGALTLLIVCGEISLRHCQ